MRARVHLAVLALALGAAGARAHPWRAPDEIEKAGQTALADEFAPIAAQLRTGNIERAFPACLRFIQSRPGEQTWLSGVRAMWPNQAMGEIGGGRDRDPKLPDLKAELFFREAEVLEKLGEYGVSMMLYADFVKPAPGVSESFHDGSHAATNARDPASGRPLTELAQARLAAFRARHAWILPSVDALESRLATALTATDFAGLEKLVNPVSFGRTERGDDAFYQDSGRGFVRALRSVWPAGGVRVWRVRDPAWSSALDRLAVTGLTGRMRGFTLVFRPRGDGVAWVGFIPHETDAPPEHATPIGE